LVLLTISISARSQLIPTYVVSIPMRDGKFLAADVYVPESCTSCPTILIQTPYNKNSFRNGLPLGYLQNLQNSPYAWVVVDWRGFYGSISAAVSQPQRGEDGYDAISWIVSQEWSNGKVGTWGPSALGGIQYQTAQENHPNHTCAVPLVAHPQANYGGYFYGGVLEKAKLQTLDFLGYGLSTLILSNPYYNLFWQLAETSTWYPESINIPMLIIGGWYDFNIDKMIEWYEAVRTQANPLVQNKQWLQIGPWVHGGTGPAYVGSAQQGELMYTNAAFKSDSMARRFFEFYLLNQNNNWEASPKITYYELGKNLWASSNSTSIAASSTSPIFLNANGTLSPQMGTGSTSFESNPNNPSPTLGGATLSAFLNQGPFDQISLASRSDVITFATGPLPNSVTISGVVKVTLQIECNQPDADIAIRLTDVYPDGRNMLINDGIRRMRFRNGYTQSDVALMAPGQVYSVEVELPFVNYTWQEGHALKIFISANSAIRWDVNLQNGGPMYVAGDALEAEIIVHHNDLNPSRIELPGSNLFTSANHIELKPSLQLYPNPAEQIVFFSGDIFSKVIVYNALGQFVFSRNMLPNEQFLNIEGLLPGIYIVRLKSDKGNYSTRLVKSVRN
jgi:uncharacterized protein